MGIVLRRSQAKTTAVEGQTKMAKSKTAVRRSSSRGGQPKTKNDDKKLLKSSNLYIAYTVRKNGYKGLILEKIMGITEKFSQLMFVVKWKNIKKPVLVESSYMNKKYPEKVIEYYESITEWQNSKQQK